MRRPFPRRMPPNSSMYPSAWCAPPRWSSKKGIPELRHAVEQGRLPVSAAEQAARLDADMQQRIVQEADAGRANVVRTTLKKAKREKREAELGAKQRALPEKKYGVIYADPEWRMEPYSRETGLDRAPDNHYPTTDTLDIITRPVGAIAAADCVLFLWATAPMLTQALNVMSAWGFEYKNASHLAQGAQRQRARLGLLVYRRARAAAGRRARQGGRARHGLRSVAGAFAGRPAFRKRRSSPR